jgi:hypothetical protein
VTTRTLLARYVIAGLVISLPFTVIHLIAKPDDAPITPLQHIMAAFANFFGPWGVAIVRVVDFPNAGLRSFSWALAVALTVIGGLLILVSIRMKHRYVQYLFIALWALFTMVWFTVGLRQIASGLL